MVSTRPPTSKSSRPFNNTLVTVPKAPITIGIIVTFMFHSFFQFSSKVEVLILLFTFFQFYSVVTRDSKVDYFASSLFLLLLIIIKSGLLAGIRWSVWMLKSHRSFIIIIIIIIIIIYSFRVFHINVSWWFFTGFWVIASLLKSPGLVSRLLNISVSWWSFPGVWVTASLFRFLRLFSLFDPIFRMLWSGWSQFFLWFPIPLVIFLNLLWLFQVHQLNGVIVITVILMFRNFFSSRARSKYKNFLKKRNYT